jgi:hypothetical protein
MILLRSGECEEKPAGYQFEIIALGIIPSYRTHNHNRPLLCSGPAVLLPSERRGFFVDGGSVNGTSADEWRCCVGIG